PVRAGAVAALAEIAGEQVVPDLLKILTDQQEEPFVRQKAAESLGKVRDLRAVPALLAVLDDCLSKIDDDSENDGYDIAREAVDALRRIGGQQEIQGLLAQIGNKVGHERDTRYLYWATELCEESTCLPLSDTLVQVYGAVDAWKPHDFARQKIIQA